MPDEDGRTVAYRIGSETWVSAERVWSRAYWISFDPAEAPYHQPSFDVPFEADATVLVAPERGDAESIRVIDRGVLRFRSDRIVPALERRP